MDRTGLVAGFLRRVLFNHSPSRDRGGSFEFLVCVCAGKEKGHLAYAAKDLGIRKNKMAFMRLKFLFLFSFFLFIFIGSGCAPTEFFRSTTSSQPLASSLKEATDKMSFSAGDTFELRQTVLGLGAFLPDITKSTSGIRFLKIEKFESKKQADVSWLLPEERETVASQKAGEAYRKDLQDHPRAIGEKTPSPPTVQKEQVTTSGTLNQINLATIHSLFPPAYWGTGVVDLHQDQGALWLSSDAFDELVKTRKTVLSFGVLDLSAAKFMKNVDQLKAVIAKIRRQSEEEQGKHDPLLLEAEGDFISWPLKVNGAEINVSAIRARNWFGEIVVLNNSNNPLILKLTLNPLVIGT
ncbi:MAG: hypothetical protein Q8R07_05900, partial [Candidatus Uhrbacteria bacterium]|nr:hypothetical protein [Candidatus Uhrbacteria bacterium]